MSCAWTRDDDDDDYDYDYDDDDHNIDIGRANQQLLIIHPSKTTG